MIWHWVELKKKNIHPCASGSVTPSTDNLEISTWYRGTPRTPSRAGPGTSEPVFLLKTQENKFLRGGDFGACSLSTWPSSEADLLHGSMKSCNTYSDPSNGFLGFMLHVDVKIAKNVAWVWLDPRSYRLSRIRLYHRIFFITFGPTLSFYFVYEQLK